MARPSEARINKTLAALRELAVDNEREMGGHRVADIPPLEGTHPSLNDYLLRRFGIASGSAGMHIGILVKAGFVQPGDHVAKSPRWVRLGEEVFSYED